MHKVNLEARIIVPSVRGRLEIISENKVEIQDKEVSTQTTDGSATKI
jgi:hypothetical protein